MPDKVAMIAVLVRAVRSRVTPIPGCFLGICSNNVRQLNSGSLMRDSQNCRSLDSPESPSDSSHQMSPQSGRGESGEETRKRKRFTGKEKLEKDLRKWGWDDADAADSAESRGIKMLTLINLDLGWKFPSKIKEAMSWDPTFFHGRDGMAQHWTPPSSATTKKGPLCDAFVKVLQAQQSMKRK